MLHRKEEALFNGSVWSDALTHIENKLSCATSTVSKSAYSVEAVFDRDDLRAKQKLAAYTWVCQ